MKAQDCSFRVDLESNQSILEQMMQNSRRKSLWKLKIGPYYEVTMSEETRNTKNGGKAKNKREKKKNYLNFRTKSVQENGSTSISIRKQNTSIELQVSGSHVECTGHKQA